jgi:cation/acetate symporter
MLILMSVPALAAYAKLEIYGAMAAGTPLTSLPAWLESPLRADLAHIHGISLAMLEQVANAVSDGAADPSTIANHLAVHSLAMEQRWLALDEQVRTAIVEAARALGAAPAPDSLWQTYVGSVLPAAATAAGNEAAVLTQAALAIEPLGLLLALPALSGAPQGLVMAGVIFAALVFTQALIRSMLPVVLIGRKVEASTGILWTVSVLVIAAVAAGFAALRLDGLTTIAVACLSLAAAGLFPVLALGLAWKRATAAGAISAILLGAGVTLYYDVGIQVFPAEFFRTWAPLSNAPEFAVENFRATELDAQEAESDEAKAQAAASLEVLARGTSGRPGLANWMGIDSASGAIFGVPLGFLALVLVSLFTSRRRTQP